MTRKGILCAFLLGALLVVSCRESKKEAPVILLRSGWQTENIGDIAHTPGFLALAEEYIPEARVIFWPWYSLLPDEEVAMLKKRFPKLEIVVGKVDRNGIPTTPELAEAFQKADIFVHNSGPSTLGWKEALAFKKLTGRPFGVYGVTYGLYGIPEKDALSEAAFVFFRDTVSLEAAKKDGVHSPIMGWAPDAAFATDVEDAEKAKAYLASVGLEEGKFICVNPNHRRTPFWEHTHKGRPYDPKVDARNQEMRAHDHDPMLEAITRIVRETDLKVLVCHEDYTEIPIGKEWILDCLPEDVKPRVVWRDEPWTLDEALGVYKRSTGLFSHEMHCPIMCVGNGIPAIVVRWAEQSSKGLMWQTIGLGDWLFDFDDEADVARYVSVVLDFAKNHSASLQKTAKARAFVKQHQKESMAVVRETMYSKSSPTRMVTMSRDELLDKIKGGWAGQTIGCQYGGPTEFKWRGTMIQEYVPIRWDEGNIKNQILHGAGLFDDIYMDLTFVEVFDRLGINAPVDSFAMAFAHAKYTLWHANQAARYKLLNGVMPPASGHWLNNPHADDLDYQIESDYAGLMSPGMPNAASSISDKIGHIMNYGDGWYGGVYVGALYSLAFVEKDIEKVVEGAVRTIPEGSRFRSCMDDVLRWYRQYPDNWKQTWFECQCRWSEDIGCPDGVMQPYDIDAVINSAYITIGLLYGGGDFFKTIDISTRCGQDSDCNPSSAGGVLGTLLGYSNIPEKWLSHLQEAEDIRFPFTHSSLNDTYRMSFSQALENIRLHGGDVRDNEVTIRVQSPEPVRLEQGFTDMVPFRRMQVNRFAEPSAGFSFEGNGFALTGSINKIKDRDYCAELLVTIDGAPYRTMTLPVDFVKRSQELCWAYQLPQGEHQVELTWLNPVPEGNLHCNFATLYRSGEEL